MADQVTAAHPYWSRTPGEGEMWCEGFDADLLNVVPGAMEALGDMAAAGLLVHGHASNGKLNHPSCWNSPEGTFFWTPDHPELGKPAAYWTDSPVVACTFGEAVRDAWAHSLTVTVNRVPVWNSPYRPFERLMWDVRGWTVLPDAEREQIRGRVRRSLAAAADRLRALIPPLPSPDASEPENPSPWRS